MRTLSVRGWSRPTPVAMLVVATFTSVLVASSSGAQPLGRPALATEAEAPPAVGRVGNEVITVEQFQEEMVVKGLGELG